MTTYTYQTKSAWPDGAQWEYYVENTENGLAAYPEYGYTTKEDCDQWIEEAGE